MVDEKTIMDCAVECTEKANEIRIINKLNNSYILSYKAFNSF